MKIREILSQHRNDFTAELECEHCERIQMLKTGYDDFYYHNHVIPSMHCRACGKNRSGYSEEEQQ